MLLQQKHRSGKIKYIVTHISNVFHTSSNIIQHTSGKLASFVGFILPTLKI